MPINWFPGHMNSTRRAIVERMPDIDVVIEMLDARVPGSSANPLLAELTRGKPSLKVLNKQDIADAERTGQWLDWYGAQSDTRAIALDSSVAGAARHLVKASRDLVPLRGGMVKPVRVLICGIPNVGKSTLINTLVGQRSAHTGDEPGITKVEQKIKLDDDFYLFDTPGMLWPRISVDEAGYNLAACGSVGRNAYDEEEVALELLSRLVPTYADRVEARYKLEGVASLTGDALLAEIGRKRGALMTGGRLNMQKAAEVVINDFRSGALGRATLETPADWQAWLTQAAIKDAERLARKDKRSKARSPQRGDVAEG